ncbi:MAG: PP0621 family protein [Burkholderiales bacterium]|jgi:uncharacterized protein|nr:PP0621 family protein [Burkholderiales bacterium]MDP2398014.1 PP0621 family protein [Burkholderiales bacterium]MDP3715253.1 PP0621 family protein [Burkholderiales bacterium]
MVKYLLVVIVVALAIWLLRGQRRRRRADERPVAPPQDMVACAHCGVHFPRGESMSAGGRQFCSESHRDEYRPQR